MNSPAFQFYPADFLVGTADMTAEEVGGYMRLLCYQWSKDGLPDDDSKLAIMAGCGGSAIAAIRLKFGICGDGKLRNARLESVRLDQEAYRAKQSENAKKRKVGTSTDKPPISNGIAVAKPTHMPNECPSPSSSEEGGTGVSEVFAKAWNELGDPFPEIRSMSEGRKVSLRSRLRDPFWRENWKHALTAMKASEFCRGKNERGWVADAEFFLRPDSVAKIMEGRYSSKKPVVSDAKEFRRKFGEPAKSNDTSAQIDSMVEKLRQEVEE